MTVDKVYSNAKQAVADIPDGASIMIGGFTSIGGMPDQLILALRDQRAKGLTIIANSLGSSYAEERKWGRIEGHVGTLAENGQVRKGIASFPVSPSASHPTAMETLFLDGKVEIEAVPQGTLSERIRMAAAGLGGFYTRVGVGTPLEEGKEKRVFGGEEYLLESPLRADYAFLKAHKADRMGNLVYKGTSRNFNPLMAAAAKITIVQAEQLVDVGDLDYEAIVTPGVYVDRIVRQESL